MSPSRRAPSRGPPARPAGTGRRRDLADRVPRLQPRRRGVAPQDRRDPRVRVGLRHGRRRSRPPRRACRAPRGTAELRRRYSTRPGEADAALVTELGLFDYLTAAWRYAARPKNAWRRCARRGRPAYGDSCSRSASPSTPSPRSGSSARRCCRPCGNDADHRRSRRGVLTPHGSRKGPQAVRRTRT